MKMPFVKMSGSGNDFVVIDNRKNILPLSISSFAIKVCGREYACADGLLLLEKSSSADFKMRIFNSDGSEAQMCGNGIRCIALFAFERKIARKRMIIETKAGLIDASVNGNAVKANLGFPKNPVLNRSVVIAGRNIKVHSVNTGVPHAVVFNENIEKLGRLIRRHKIFGRAGANADFVKVINSRTIKVRTYERGVEAETMACGTGAAASAYICGRLGFVKWPVKVITSGGELLSVGLKPNGIYLDGKVMNVFEGKLFWRGIK